MPAARSGLQDSTGDRRDRIYKGGDDPRCLDRQIAVVFDTLMPRRRDVGVALAHWGQYGRGKGGQRALVKVMSF